MGNALKTIILCFGLTCNSLWARNLEYKVLDEISAVTNRQGVIKSSTTGKLDLPIEVIKGYIERPVFSGKILLCLGDSPYYSCSSNNSTIFYDNQGHTSVYNVVRSNSDTQGLEQISRIKGNRVFGKFDSITFLSLKKNPDDATEYRNDMYIDLENRFLGSVIRSLMTFPLVGEKLKKSFQEEQDGFVKSVKKTIDNSLKNPSEAVNRIESYTNGPISFTREEINFFSNSLKRLNLEKY